MHFELFLTTCPLIMPSAVEAVTCAPKGLPSGATPPTEVLGGDAFEVQVNDCAEAMLLLANAAIAMIA
ncbi:hypothetical protein [Sphingorhabdus sp.]|uniref:hypothetical protein n=1 Tax=Sphingorhabdus sp. TaxID=1902408 RepID=UPI00405398D9